MNIEEDYVSYEVAKYTSMLEAAKANGVTGTAISAAIHGYCKTCKNNIFEYE